MQNISKESITYSGGNESILNKSIDNTVLPRITEEKINHNKPWRVVIKRIVADGRSDNENISGNATDNKSV